MRLLNLTPHAIVIMKNSEDQLITFPASGETVRLNTEARNIDAIEVNGVSLPIMKTKVIGFAGLPTIEDITSKGYDGILVSSMVLDSLPEDYSHWAFAPDTGSTAVRDSKGFILGVTQLRTI